jgi:hypothetical protein
MRLAQYRGLPRGLFVDRQHYQCSPSALLVCSPWPHMPVGCAWEHCNKAYIHVYTGGGGSSAASTWGNGHRPKQSSEHAHGIHMPATFIEQRWAGTFYY